METDTVTFVTDLINQTGFPIAACICLFWIVNKSLKSQHEILVELKTAINNNTKAIAEISNKQGM